MTTIIFDEDINIKKSHFKNLSEFGEYILNDTQYHQLQTLGDDEITDVLKKKADETRKMPSSSFVNI